MNLNQLVKSVFEENNKEVFQKKCLEPFSFDNYFYALLNLSKNIKTISYENDPVIKYTLEWTKEYDGDLETFFTTELEISKVVSYYSITYSFLIKDKKKDRLCLDMEGGEEFPYTSPQRFFDLKLEEYFLNKGIFRLSSEESDIGVYPFYVNNKWESLRSLFFNDIYDLSPKDKGDKISIKTNTQILSLSDQLRAESKKYVEEYPEKIKLWPW